MPLAVVASAAAPPLRPPEPFRFLHTPKRVTLTRTPSLQCSPSLPVSAPPAEPKPKPRRYPKQFPGEAVGVAEEMRFVAMRLRNPKRTTLKEEAEEETKEEEEGEGWMPTVEGFVRYLVDSKLVFDTVERIIAESTDVAYVYFRKSGLERSASIAKDLEWFKEQEVEIPEPSSYGTTYAAYLTELAESNAPAFLSHYYNIYFAHITGGVAIGSKICKKILEGREMELYKWDNDVELLLKDAREKLNELSKHWSRKDRNLCLKEAAKCFQYLGRIVRLIIS